MVVATHAVDWIVVTMSGNELTLSESEVDKLEEVVVPNKVAVAGGLHAIGVRARVLQGHNAMSGVLKKRTGCRRGRNEDWYAV